MKTKRKIIGKHKIGYGRPPDDSKYKKGQCGNPEGGRLHKKRNTSVAAEIEKAESERVTLVTGGKRQKVPANEAIYRQMMNQAMKGTLSAARQVLRLSIKYLPKEEDRQQQTLFVLATPRTPKSA